MITFCIIVVVVVLIIFQLKYFRENSRNIEEFTHIFSSKDSSFKLNDVYTRIDEDIELNEDDPDSYIQYSRISDTSNKNPIFKLIEKSINSYLKENTKASIDYHLIKDIVDRHCDTQEEIIENQISHPLYFGLIATMAGVICGILPMIYNGYLDEYSLLKDVAIAMVSSIVGVIMTIYGSRLYKASKVELEKNKNVFLSWIQVNLLPTLSSDMASEVGHLSESLASFNHSFSKNIGSFEGSFENLKPIVRNMTNLVEKVVQIDTVKIIDSNIAVYDSLKNSSKEIGRFNEYIHGVNNYIDNVTKLSDQINQHLDRTQVIEELAVFFKKERGQMEQWNTVVARSVQEAGETFLKLSSEFTEKFTENMTQLSKREIESQQKFSLEIDQSRNDIRSRILQLEEDFTTRFEAVNSNFLSKIESVESTNTELKESVDNLAVFYDRQTQVQEEFKSSLNQLTDYSSKQDKTLETLIDAINNISVNVTTPNIPEIKVAREMAFPKLFWFLIIIPNVLLLLAIILYIYHFFIF